MIKSKALSFPNHLFPRAAELVIVLKLEFRKKKKKGKTTHIQRIEQGNDSNHQYFI